MIRAAGLLLLAFQAERPAEAVRVLSFRHVHGAGVRSIAFSPDRTRFATGGVDASVRVWDAASGRPLLELNGPAGGAPALSFTPDGLRLVAGGGDGSVQVWDALNGRALTALPGHPRGVYSLAVSPDASVVATADGEGTIRLSEVAAARELRSFQVPSVPDPRTFRARQPAVYDLAFSPDGKALASIDNSGMIRLWQTATGQPILALEAHGAGGHSLAMGPDGRTFASASEDSTIRLWDAATGRELLRLRQREESRSRAGFQTVTISPDGMWLAAGESMNCEIYVWEVASGARLRLLSGHEGGVISLAFAPDGRRLLSGAADRTVRIWDLEPSGPPGREDPREAVEGLVGSSPERAHAALWSLVRKGAPALPALAERLRFQEASEERIRSLILDLDDDDLIRRDQAMGELVRLGPLAERALRRSEEEGTAEQKARIEPLLKALESPLVAPGEALGRLRAIQAVERIPGAGATDVLRRIAEGSRSAREQWLARTALSRRAAAGIR